MGFEDTAGPGDDRGDEGKRGKGHGNRRRKIELAYVHATFAPQESNRGDDSSRGSDFAATTNNENGRLEVIKNEKASDGMTISEIKSEDNDDADDQERHMLKRKERQGDGRGKAESTSGSRGEEGGGEEGRDGWADQDEGGDSDKEPEDADDSAQSEGDHAEEDVLSDVAKELSKARQEDEDHNDEARQEDEDNNDEDQEDATKDESSLLEGEQMELDSEDSDVIEDILDKNEDNLLRELDSVTSLSSS